MAGWQRSALAQAVRRAKAAMDDLVAILEADPAAAPLPGSAPPFAVTREHPKAGPARTWITVDLGHQAGYFMHADNTRCGHGLDLRAAEPEPGNPRAVRVVAPLTCNGGQVINGWSSR